MNRGSWGEQMGGIATIIAIAAIIAMCSLIVFYAT